MLDHLIIAFWFYPILQTEKNPKKNFARYLFWISAKENARKSHDFSLVYNTFMSITFLNFILSLAKKAVTSHHWMDLGLTSIMIEDLKLQSRELLLLNYCSGLIGFFSSPVEWCDFTWISALCWKFWNLKVVDYKLNYWFYVIEWVLYADRAKEYVMDYDDKSL